MVKYGFDTNWNAPDFHEGKSIESKCNKTVVDHITQISSRIPHPYNDNIRVQIVRNYIIYYIAALAESKVAFIQNSLKIRSPNSSVGTNPSTVKLLRAKLLSRTCVLKCISTICTGHSHPMSIALWKLDASWIYSKGTYKARVSYVLAYQVYIYINSWSSFNTIPTPIPPHFCPEPGFDPRIDIPPSPHYHHTITQSIG